MFVLFVGYDGFVQEEFALHSLVNGCVRCPVV